MWEMLVITVLKFQIQTRYKGKKTWQNNYDRKTHNHIFVIQFFVIKEFVKLFFSSILYKLFGRSMRTKIMLGMLVRQEKTKMGTQRLNHNYLCSWKSFLCQLHARFRWIVKLSLHYNITLKCKIIVLWFPHSFLLSAIY